MRPYMMTKLHQSIKPQLYQLLAVYRRSHLIITPQLVIGLRQRPRWVHVLKPNLNAVQANASLWRAFAIAELSALTAAMNWTARVPITWEWSDNFANYVTALSTVTMPAMKLIARIVSLRVMSAILATYASTKAKYVTATTTVRMVTMKANA